MDHFFEDENLQMVFNAYYEQTDEAVVVTELLSEAPLAARFIHVNKKGCELLGYSAEELKELNPLTVFFKHMDPELFLAVKERFYLNRHITLDMEICKTSGCRINVSANSNLLEYAGRKVIYTVMKETVRADGSYTMLLSEREFAFHLIDVMQVFIVLLSLDGKVDGGNFYCSERTGFIFDEMNGKPFWEILSNNDDETKAFFMGRSSGYHETDWICKHGEKVPIRWLCRNTEAEDLDFRVFTGIELSGNRKYMQKLKKSRALLESVKIRYYDAIACGVTVQDPAGRIVFANECASELLGVGSSSLLNMDSSSPEWQAVDQFGNALSAKDHPSMVTLRTKKEISHYIMGIWHPVREMQRWISIHTKLLYTGRSREVEYIIATFQDVTEKIKLDEKIKAQEKLALAGRFAVSVAHEIRNPLTAILGFMKLMESGKELNSEYMRIMKKELDHIQQVTSEFLMLASPEISEMEFLDLYEDLLQPVLISLLPDLKSKMITIETNLTDVPLMVRGKADALRRLFLNFLTNSIEAILEKGSISISFKQKGQQHIIEIKDTGSGIEPERLPFLGEPFYSLKEKGTGIGLLICKKILEDHKGYFDVNSTLEEGTCITIFLPAASEPGTEAT